MEATLEMVMTKCKVAHVTSVSLSLRYLLLKQMQSIQAAGYDVVGISTPGPDVIAIEAEGVAHIPVTINRNVSPIQDLKSVWQLYRVMRREKFTIVHTHTPKAGLLAQLAARLAGVPVVINTLHGLYLHEHMRPMERRFYIALEKLAALCSDVILSQSREDMQTAIKEGICKPERIRHLGNGIDLAQFDPARFTGRMLQEERAEIGITDGIKVVGFVGRLTRRKGFLDFLAAGRQIVERYPDVRFLIVGESDKDKPDSVDPAVAKNYGLDGHCIFLGTQPNDRLPLLYCLMDVLVLPSQSEGLPRVIMESAAMGVPAVGSHVKGNREAIVDGRSGLLVPLRDVPALTNAVLSLLNDPGKARQMGQEGRTFAQEHFDEQVVFAAVADVYRRLTKGTGLSSALRPHGCTPRAHRDDGRVGKMTA
jgi:glycosyltransferase involved in cell wall biosynthesis